MKIIMESINNRNTSWIYLYQYNYGYGQNETYIYTCKTYNIKAVVFTSHSCKGDNFVCHKAKVRKNHVEWSVSFSPVTFVLVTIFSPELCMSNNNGPYFYTYIQCSFDLNSCIANDLRSFGQFHHYSERREIGRLHWASTYRAHGADRRTFFDVETWFSPHCAAGKCVVGEVKRVTKVFKSTLRLTL